MGDKNVLVIAYQNSVIVRGMEKHLTESRFNVTTMGNDLPRLRRYTDMDHLIILFLSGDVFEDIRNLKDTMAAFDCSGREVIIIGEKKDKDEIIRSVPELAGKLWLDKPVNMELLVRSVDKLMVDKEDKARKKRILIVDDDPAYAKMVREWLKDSYHVDIVTAGVQAITFLVKTKVDLILLDYEMPIVDGPQVLQMLRSDPETADIPVVFLTGVGTRESVQRVMALKPRGYILKSTTRMDLLESLWGMFSAK